MLAILWNRPRRYDLRRARKAMNRSEAGMVRRDPRASAYSPRWVVQIAVPGTLRALACVTLDLALASSLLVAASAQTEQSRSSSDATMRQHYDAAYRLQAAGDLSAA